MAAAGADDGMTGRRSSGAAFGQRQIVVAIPLKKFRSFQAGALHARRYGDGPRVEHDARRNFHGEAVGCQLGHLASGHVEEAASVLGDVRRIDGVDAEINGIAPRSSGMVGVHDPQAVVRREINVIAAIVLAEIRSPYAAVITRKRGRYGTPVDQIARVPDQKSGRVIKAGVREIKIVADANRAGIRMVSAENRIAVRGGACLRQEQTSLRGKGKAGGQGGSVLNKAAAIDHFGASLIAACREVKSGAIRAQSKLSI